MMNQLKVEAEKVLKVLKVLKVKEENRKWTMPKPKRLRTKLKQKVEMMTLFNPQVETFCLQVGLD